MTFARPVFLWGLLALPLLWVLYAAAHRTFVRRRQAFGEIDVLAQMGYPARFGRSHLKFGLLTLACACTLVALARPLGGPTSEAVVAEGADVVVLLDASDSMNTTDVAPNRREVAYQFLDEWLHQLRGERVAVILFAGEPVVLCPLTLDYAAVRTFLADAQQGTLVKQGTSLGDSIRMALDRFPPHEEGGAGRALLLLSDGEDHGSRPEQAAEEARDAGVPLFAIGFGTLEGGRIPIAANPWGERLYKRYQDRDVVSRLDEALLKSMAEKTRGAYWRMQQDPLLPLLARLRRLPGQQVHSAALQRRREWFPLFVVLAVLLLGLDTCIAPRPPHDHRARGQLSLRWSAGWRSEEPGGPERRRGDGRQIS